MRRVVATGMGMLSPLANGVSESWDKIVKSESGIDRIDDVRFDDYGIPVKIAGAIDKGVNPGQFNVDNYLSIKEKRRVGEFIVYAMVAADEAVKDAGIDKINSEQLANRTGVIIGSGIGGIDGIADNTLILEKGGQRKISPFFIPGCLINFATGNISIKYGFKGPSTAVVTACSTGAHAIGDAARIIKYNDADIMVAGGTESAISPIAVSGFVAARALSIKNNDNPQRASRPWDKDRDGFVMGEGAGILVLEEYEHAKKRGAKMYAEVLGYGLTGDAYHITAPEVNGDGAYRSMQNALNDAKINGSDIDYINAHGTSTVLGDTIELTTVKRLFNEHRSNLAMSSTKSSTGHLLGAAGSVEAIFSILAIQNGILPPTLNLENPEETYGIDLVPLVAKEKNISTVLSNSFGFGGTNASLIFRKI